MRVAEQCYEAHVYVVHGQSAIAALLERLEVRGLLPNAAVVSLQGAKCKAWQANAQPCRASNPNRPVRLQPTTKFLGAAQRSTGNGIRFSRRCSVSGAPQFSCTWKAPCGHRQSGQKAAPWAGKGLEWKPNFQQPFFAGNECAPVLENPYQYQCRIICHK